MRRVICPHCGGQVWEGQMPTGRTIMFEVAGDGERFDLWIDELEVVHRADLLPPSGVHADSHRKWCPGTWPPGHDDLGRRHQRR